MNFDKMYWVTVSAFICMMTAWQFDSLWMRIPVMGVGFGLWAAFLAGLDKRLKRYE